MLLASKTTCETPAPTGISGIPKWRKWPFHLVVLLPILGYFLFLARKGVLDYFNPDDTYNMYLGWTKTYSHLLYTSVVALWEGETRPVGALFYKAGYQLFGFDPLPFRVACFTLLLANLVLQFKLYNRLLGTGPFAALALLIGCFNGVLWSIYASTGTVFDVLCEFFLLLALLAYIHCVERPRKWPLLLVYASTLWAIQSKEMGYSIPVLLVCYEACYGIPASRRKWRAAGAASLRILPAVLVAGIGVWAMIFRGAVSFRHPSYIPQISWTTYVQTTSSHLTMLFYRVWNVSAADALLVLGGSLLLAVVLRSRAALFAWLFFIAALLPVSFLPARQDGYVLYIPYIGCALYLAAVAEALTARLTALAPDRVRAWIPAAVCLLCAAIVIPVQIIQSAGCVRQGFGPGGHGLVRDLAATAAMPGAASMKRVILIDDAWGKEEWQPVFIVQLSRHAPDIKVLKITSEEIRAGKTPELRDGDQILQYSDHAYREAQALR